MIFFLSLIILPPYLPFLFYFSMLCVRHTPALPPEMGGPPIIGRRAITPPRCFPVDIEQPNTFPLFSSSSIIAVKNNKRPTTFSPFLLLYFLPRNHRSGYWFRRDQERKQPSLSSCSSYSPDLPNTPVIAKKHHPITPMFLLHVQLSATERTKPREAAGASSLTTNCRLCFLLHLPSTLLLLQLHRSLTTGNEITKAKERSWFSIDFSSPPRNLIDHYRSFSSWLLPIRFFYPDQIKMHPFVHLVIFDKTGPSIVALN